MADICAVLKNGYSLFQFLGESYLYYLHTILLLPPIKKTDWSAAFLMLLPTSNRLFGSNKVHAIFVTYILLISIAQEYRNLARPVHR